MERQRTQDCNTILKEKRVRGLPDLKIWNKAIVIKTVLSIAIGEKIGKQIHETE